MIYFLMVGFTGVCIFQNTNQNRNDDAGSATFINNVKTQM